jgi:hypothetical protein
MSIEDIKPGDRVRITIEGEVNLHAKPWVLVLENRGQGSYTYLDEQHIISIEKIEGGSSPSTPRGDETTRLSSAPPPSHLDLEKGICSCGNRFDGDNLCMVSACQMEGFEDLSKGSQMRDWLSEQAKQSAEHLASLPRENLSPMSRTLLDAYESASGKSEQSGASEPEVESGQLAGKSEQLGAASDFRQSLKCSPPDLPEGPCGSCGEPAIHTITLRGKPMPVCLRHLNHWRTPDYVEEIVNERLEEVVRKIDSLIASDWNGTSRAGMKVAQNAVRAAQTPAVPPEPEGDYLVVVSGAVWTPSEVRSHGWERLWRESGPLKFYDLAEIPGVKL